MRDRWRRFLPGGLLVLAIIIAGCGGDGSGPPPTPAAVEVVSGSGQTGPAGQPLAEPLRAKVSSDAGAGIEGVTIRFAAATGSGSVSPDTATTGADGTAATTWTVGTTAGAAVDTVLASTDAVSAPVIFTATVRAGGAAALAGVSGDGQGGITGQALAAPLIAVARDGFGNPAQGAVVAWAVTAGGGSVSLPTVAADSQGQAAITWTLGSEAGEQQVTASLSGSPGAQVAFAATAAAPGSIVLSMVSPAPLVEGQAATLTGVGFSATPAGNQVTVDGQAATVVTATASALTITVPTFDCQPARPVPVKVKVGGATSNSVTQALEPATFTQAPLGQQVVIQDPSQFCLQFAPSTSAEEYLVGVQSTSEVVTSVTPAVLTAVAAAGTAASSPLPAAASRGHLLRLDALSNSEALRRRAKHYAAEARRREAERLELVPRLLRAWRGSPGARQARAASIPRTLEVGDTVDIRVPNSSCTNFSQIRAAVRVVGTKGVWLEDVDNPSGRYTAGDFRSLSDLFDEKIYATDVSYFGAPTDLDGNGRIAVVITREVNRLEAVLGFVAPTDFLTRSECSSSNEGEFFYARTPDPTGIFGGGGYPRDVALQDLPPTVAHEFTHIIQVGRRLSLDLPSLLVIWEGEGQAVLAEEVTGHAVEGRQPGQNYGGRIAFNADDPGSLDWYLYGFVTLAIYYGFNGTDTKVSGAPEQCSWLDNAPSNDGPCERGGLPYGASWAFLRWLSDQFGPAFPDGERGLQRALIENPGTGYANVSSVIGMPIRTLLAQWAATLYADDRGTGLDRKLTLPSWNLFDVYELNTRESARLVPRVRSFGGFADGFSVRAASTAYFRVSGSGRPAVAIRVRGASGGLLPAVIQLFVVRLR